MTATLNRRDPLSFSSAALSRQPGRCVVTYSAGDYGDALSELYVLPRKPDTDSRRPLIGHVNFAQPPILILG